MFGWIIGSSMRFRLLVLAAAAALFVVGIAKLHDVPVDVLPEYVPPTVEIQTEALGLSAAEVEQLITVPMEQDLLAGVAFLDDIRSESLPGLSRIFLVFEPGTDIFRARQVVGERLTQAHALPNVSKPPQMLQPLSSTNRVMIVGASSSELSPIEMGVLARWTVAPKLVGVEGVANVSIWGFRDRQLQVRVDPERLREKGVSLVQVVETTGNALWFSPLTFVEASTPGVGGFIDTPNQRLGVQHLSPIESAEDLARVRVEDTSDLVLGDIASVVEDHQPLIGDALVDQGDGDLLFVVEKLPEASTVDVTRKLESAIADLKPGLASVEFDTSVYRPASYIDGATDNVRTALIVAAALLALALVAFFLRWRTALVAFVVVPLSLMAAVLVLWAAGTTVNAIVLAGLVAAIVLVIDDAVSTVDNIVKRLRQNRLAPIPRPAASVVIDATRETRVVAAYAALVVALALLPLFFTNALPGTFFPDLAGAFLVAVAVSFVVALTVAPALAALLLVRTPLERKQPVGGRLESWYGRSLGTVVSQPRWAYLGIASAVVGAALAAPFLSSGLLSTLKEEQVLIRWDGPPGTSLPEMSRITGLAARELRALPGVEGVGAHVGRAVGSDLSAGANSAELWVGIAPTADYEATMAAIKRVAGSYPGLSRNVGVFSNERAQSTFSSADKDIVVRVYGEDPDALRAQAERVRTTVAEVDGVADASVQLPPVEPTIEIEVDLAEAQEQGIKPGDVRRAASTLLGGLVVGNLFEQQKVFEVVVWGTPETRTDIAALPNLLIDTPDGDHVLLGDVADVRIAPNPAVIERHSISRFLDVGASASGRDRDAVTDDVENRVGEMQFPLEYRAEVLDGGGQPVGRLIGLGIGAAIGVFLLLQACFASWRLATLAFLTFPVGVSGAVLATLANGDTLDFGSVIALFAVFAVTVANGVLLIHRFRVLEQRWAGEPRDKLVVEGARERLTPILLTATATILVLMPFAVAGGIAGYELVHPIAITMIGGLVTSTLTSLFVVPTVYAHLGRSTAAESDLSTIEWDELFASVTTRQEAPPAAFPVGSGVLQMSPTSASPPGRRDLGSTELEEGSR